MHVDSEKDPIETRVKGHYTICCIILWVVHMVHATRNESLKGLRSFGCTGFPLIWANHPLELCKEIGTWRAVQLAKCWPRAFLWVGYWFYWVLGLFLWENTLFYHPRFFINAIKILGFWVVAFPAYLLCYVPLIIFLLFIIVFLDVSKRNIQSIKSSQGM